MKSAACYIRVSTDAQTEYSPDSQIKLINEYAKKNDFVITKIYSDEGISGRQADKRPSFKRMIADAGRKQFEAILVYNTSRFARNHEESIVYRNMLKREGVEVISITQPSVDYKTDILMNALYAVMDERYSIELSENVKRGMKEKVSRGIYISCAALGYKRVESNKPLVIDEAEATLVKWIFNKYINGHSMFSIAKELNQKGYVAKRGNAFDRRGIYRILSNPIYKGYLSWKCDGDVYYMRADHEPIISGEIFDEVQKALAENLKKRHYKSKDPALCAHWLTGIIRCSQCGTTYVYVKGYKGRNNRFRCGRYGNASCTNNHSMRVSEAENLVMKFIAEMPFDNIYFKTKSSPAIEKLDENNQAISLKTSGLEKALERAKQAFLQGIDTIEEYGENKNRIMAEIEALKKPSEPQENKIRRGGIMDRRFEGLKSILKSDEDVKIKNAILRSVVSRITVDAKSNELSFYFFD